MISSDPVINKPLKINIPEGLPEECLDPLTKEPLKSPRLASCGHVYSKTTKLPLKFLNMEQVFNCCVCSKDFYGSTSRFDYVINDITNDVKNIEKLTQDPVSLELIKEPFTTNCGHTLDKKTILNLVKQGYGNKCPICNYETDLRKSVKNINLANLIHRIFENATQ